VEAAGIEPANDCSQPTVEQQLRESESEVSALCLHSESISRQESAVTDIDLLRIINAWPSLPEPLKRAMIAICSDANGAER